MVVELLLKDGNCFSWGMLDAAGLMQLHCQESSAYRAMVNHAFERYPGTKLRLILHEDEIQPGNVFLLRRKVHAWYFSFREFDQFMRDDNVGSALLSCSLPSSRKYEDSSAL